MSAVRRAIARLRGLFGGGARDEDFVDELETHLSLAIDDYVRRGLPPDAARRAALLDAHGITQARESVRDQRGLPLIESTINDLAFAVRFLRNNLGLTTAIVSTLAIGIGATTTVFSIVNQVLLAPLPFRDADRIYDLNLVAPHDRGTAEWGRIASLELLQEAKRVSAIEDGMGISGLYPTVIRNGRRERLTVIVVTASFDRFLGVAPIAGRAFLASDDTPGAVPSAVVSAAYAAKYLGGASAALGQTLTFEDRAFPVVGVMPEGFHVPNTIFDDTPEIWVPMGAVMDRLAGRTQGETYLHVLLRLTPSATVATAEAMLDPLVDRLVPRSGNERLVSMLFSLRHQLSFQVRRPLWFLLGASAAVMLIACTNIASLVLARALTRRREMSIRLALGASRSRLVRQMLTESVVASLIGVVPGVLLAMLGVPLLVTLAGSSVQAIDFGDIRVSAVAMLVAVATAMITGIAIGVAPALAATRSNPARALQDGTSSSGTSRTARALSDVLVGLETAIAVVLLAGAALFVRSFTELTRSDMGYDARRVALASWTFPVEEHAASERQLAFSRRVLDRARAMPSVQKAAIASGAPGIGMTSYQAVSGLTSNGRTQVKRVSTFLFSGDYFAVLHIPIVRGVQPALASEAAIDETAARLLFPNEDPIGRIVVWGNDSSLVTVSAVVGAVLDDHIDATLGRLRDATPHLYVPMGDHPRAWGSAMVLTSEDPAKAAAILRDNIASIDVGAVVDPARTLWQMVNRGRQRDRLVAVLVSWFGVIGLFLAALGVYAVVTHATRRRTRELGVRVALGARPVDIVSLTMSRTIVVASVGGLAGIAAALALGRSIRRLLFDVSPTDPTALGGAALVFLGVALLATYLPSRRAARLDPVRALRED